MRKYTIKEFVEMIQREKDDMETKISELESLLDFICRHDVTAEEIVNMAAIVTKHGILDLPEASAEEQ